MNESVVPCWSETGLEGVILCFQSTVLQSCNCSLFQRLLRKDGKWDDDVSGFLSQARAKRVEFAEAIECMKKRGYIA